MKVNLFISAYVIILLGWISLFQIFGTMEKSAYLRSHLRQEQVNLLNTCSNFLKEDNTSNDEQVIDCYNLMLKNLEVLQFGGHYSYGSLEASLSAEKSQTQIIGLSNFDKKLKILGEQIGTSSNQKSESNSQNHDLITKLTEHIIGLDNQYDLKIKQTSNWEKSLMILWGSITIGSIAFGIALFKKECLRPIEDLNTLSDALVRGNYAIGQSTASNKIFNHLSQNIHKIGTRFQGVIEYIEQVGKGNLEEEFNLDGEDDMLGTSLLQLKEELKIVNQQERERNWANEGLTKFNDIIYAHHDDIHALAQVLISELVKYISANQGAIFRTMEEGEDEKMLELMSTYAWDKRRFVEKKLDLKSNLIGQAVLEREYMLLKNVPEEFVQITSGLGEATPRSLIILPLIFNDECCGAIELASFHDFDENKISFLNRLSENIASAILNITGNAATKKLLEESQTLTEQLKMQEEELRQNEEELEAAQESLSRKLDEATQEMQNQLNKVEAEKMKNIAILEGCEDGVVMFKSNGTMEFINSAAEEIFKQDKKHLIGKNISKLIPISISDLSGEYSLEVNENGHKKAIGLRTEINLLDHNGDELSLLVTASEGRVDGDCTYAFFIQRISVELF